MSDLKPVTLYCCKGCQHLHHEIVTSCDCGTGCDPFEYELWEARRTQPEATAPAQDLSAAILAIDIPSKCLTHQASVYGFEEGLKAAAALASSANALSAGDRVDTLDQISMIVDRDTPPDSRNEVIDHDIRGTPITRAMVERAGTWKRVRKPGQVSVGDKLRFTIGGKQKIKTAMKILHAGTEKEEVIYSTHKNFYFITSMVVDGTSTHKNVEFRAAILQSQKGAE